MRNSKLDLKVNLLVGAKIKDYRKQAGLSQRALGTKIGATATAIGMVETSGVGVNFHKLFKIAEALNIYYEQLLPTHEEIADKLVEEKQL